MPSRSCASSWMGRMRACWAISMLLGKEVEAAAGVVGMMAGVASGFYGPVMLPEAALHSPSRHTARYNRAQGSAGSPAMLWLKAFHVVFVVTWFAGLFYLPRLFVYHVATTDAAGVARFVVMERRLFVLMSLGALLAVLCGLAMIALAPGYLAMGWLRVKL